MENTKKNVNVASKCSPAHYGELAGFLNSGWRKYVTNVKFQLADLLGQKLYTCKFLLILSQFLQHKNISIKLMLKKPEVKY